MCTHQPAANMLFSLIPLCKIPKLRLVPHRYQIGPQCHHDVLLKEKLNPRGSAVVPLHWKLKKCLNMGRQVLIRDGTQLQNKTVYVITLEETNEKKQMQAAASQFRPIQFPGIFPPTWIIVV